MLYLVFDLGSGSIVSYNGSDTAIPTLYQTNPVPLQIQFVTVDSTALSGSYAVYNAAANGLVVSLASKITGVEANEATYLLAQVLQAGFAWDPVNLWFTGTLNLNTIPLATFLGTNQTLPAFFEVNLTTGGVNPETVYQGQVNVAGNAYEPGAANPAPVAGSYGTLGLQNGVGGVTIAGNLVTVAGLNWGSIPNAVLIGVNVPTGKGLIFGCYVPGSATLAQFQFNLSAPPDDNTYTFSYIPLF